MSSQYDFQDPNLVAPHPEKYADLRRQLENDVFEGIEEEHHHNPYDQEIREQGAIEHGDLEALQKSFEERYTGKLGQLAKDELRSMKNMGIVLVTLASRSAIRGGMQPEVAFSLSDLYIQRIEESRDVLSTYQMSRNAEYEYCRMVREIRDAHAAAQRKQKRAEKADQTEKTDKTDKADDESSRIQARSRQNPVQSDGLTDEQTPDNEHVTNAKNYIFRNLHGPLTVSEVAGALGLNANYLSGLFRRCTGSPMKDYILRSKISLVKNLLKYSAYSYGEIATYLGFASQSHLGAAFKKETGMTMSQYRKKYQMQEFMD